ncbi:hypothetical protein AHMF7605_21460 [Adhaeribacter arboris]|uniref:Uncharacterized protein n=1 Tax=Adhaeribacter arboris TaxID=2072846 RepID=A0A2T2YK40_9BACT|nr:hypothetical protein [Adhaeribacter arboris]PSR55884.1 hypothetical protein AHMF7605_21460 [Adhaeribacter arboris]
METEQPRDEVNKVNETLQTTTDTGNNESEILDEQVKNIINPITTTRKGKAKSSRTTKNSIYLVVALLFIVFIVLYNNQEWFITNNALLIQFYGLLWVAFTFWLIRWIFTNDLLNPKREMIAHGEGDPPPDLVRKRGFLDFFVGDDGRYSMVRLQVVAWAYIIISYQVAVLIALKINYKAGLMDFKPVFTEEVLWLLGLSLASYVSIKGITAAKSEGNSIQRATPKLADFITADNGLDFSKFQMFIWTLIAIITFLAQGTPFIVAARNYNDRTLINRLFEVPDNNKDKPPVPLPSLPWSFVVLMGLSQGAFVGKRLVPTFKISEAKDKRKLEIEELKLASQNKIKLLEESLILKKDDPAIIKELFENKTKLSDLDRELKELESIT